MTKEQLIEIYERINNKTVFPRILINCEDVVITKRV